MKSLPLPVLATFPLLSAALMTFSLPAFDLGVLGWIALAPLLFALRARGLVTAALFGWVFGMAFGAGTFYWLTEIPNLNVVRFVLLLTIFSLYYLAFGFLYAWVNRSLTSWMILVAPTLWVSMEYLRGNLFFLACPWNFLAHSQHQALPVIQIADLTGTFGISFLLLMVNQLASELPELRGKALRDRRAQIGLVGFLVAGAFAYGWYKIANVPDHVKELRVMLVQANVTARSGMSTKEQMQHLAAYGKLSIQPQQQKPDLILWPSTSLPGPIEFWMIRLYVNYIASQAGTPLLVGGAGGDKFAPPREGLLPYSNSEFLISPTGKLEGQYNKVRLTPFSEQVPLQGLVTWPRWMTTLDKSFVPGNGHTLFSVGPAKFGAPICWENTFPDVFRRFVLGGANFMVSVTNESVFGATHGPYQTLAMNVFRAVENRVAVARVATTGVSAFIDANGRIVSRVKDGRGADLFVPGTLAWDVPLAQKKSFYTLYGDLFAQLASGAAVVILLLSVLSGARVSPTPQRERKATALPLRIH